MIRRLAHVLTGMVAAAATTLDQGWALTLALTWIFLKYQRIEQRQIGDKGYPEIAEFMLGFGWVIVMLLILT